MYEQKKEIRLTEGKFFPENANPGDIHAMKIDENAPEKGSPYWQIHFRKWGYFPSWQFIENLCEADYLKYYGYHDDVKLAPFERFQKHNRVTK